MIQRIKQFIFHDIWEADLDKQPKWQSVLFRQLRIVMMGVKGFQKNKIQEKASALTYYTLLSIVPTLAMAFGIAKGFGLEEKMRESIMDSTKNNREIWEKVTEFAESMLANTQGGLIAGIGIVVLLWSVMKLLISIEEALNDIWEIRKGRSVARKVTDYLAMMILAPILLLLSGSLTVFVKSQFDMLTEQFELIGFFGPVVNFLLRFSPYFFTWILFTLLYTIMPNTRVKPKTAFVAAVIAGTGFQFFEWLYITLQIGVTRYNAIYGSFAALPLFLIWMQTSWLIVLIGAEISFANQNVEHFQYDDGKHTLSVSALKKLTVYVMYHIIQQFLDEKDPQTAEEISVETGTPVRIVRQAIFRLQEGGFIAETPTEDERTSAYIPAKDVHTIYLADINSTVERIGLNSLPIKDQTALAKVSDQLESMKELLADSKQNVLLKDL
jgi:membrane protein